MERLALLALACATVGGAYMLATYMQPQAEAGGTEETNILEDALQAINRTLQRWRPPAAYADAIAQAEDANGIPRDVLARLLYQESHWRADIIDGRTRSAAGAVGIAQFLPATAAEWGVNPLDPLDAIAGAGRYLARLHRQFGDWTRALAAYNWGPGNVARRGIAQAPAETIAYFTSILADVNEANGTAWA